MDSLVKSFKARFLNPANEARRIALDPDYYREQYKDLQDLSDTRLVKHWIRHGYREGRFASLEDENERGRPAEKALADTDCELSKLEEQEQEQEQELIYARHEEFNAGFYLHYHTDLIPGGIHTAKKAWEHYRRNGEKEGRLASLSQFFELHELPEDILPEGYNLRDTVLINADYGIEVNYAQIFSLFAGQYFYPVRFFYDDTATVEFYIALSQAYQSRALALYREQGQQQNDHYALVEPSPKSHQDQARAAQYWQCAWRFVDIARFFRETEAALYQAGSLYQDENDCQRALNCYESAIAERFSKRAALRIAELYSQTARSGEAVRWLAAKACEHPADTDLLDALSEYWGRYTDELASNSLALTNIEQRQRLVDTVVQDAAIVYRAWSEHFGAVSTPALKQNITVDRILIIGDHGIPQCRYYRIDQKKKQLEAVGCSVCVLDWHDIGENTPELISYDLVIFYRLPAMPAVLRAMAQVNARGALSFYEIDDMLFDPSYPPPIETYGGYVQLPQYQQMVRAMVMFNIAARFCRKGIASTQPPQRHLSSLVMDQQSIVHRNGLDELVGEKSIRKADNQTVDIFYGSGTQAHNADFVELALPALNAILKAYPATRLIIVGYLRLPQSFITQWQGRLVRIPPLSNIKAYWSMLARADINMAVLHSDPVNDSKSELKWFEAAQFGIPSVVSATENFTDVIHDGRDGLLCRSADEFRAHLSTLVESEAERQRMGAAARHRVQSEYSLQRLGQSLLDQVQNATNQQRGEPETRHRIGVVNVYYDPQSYGGATRVVEDNVSNLLAEHSEHLALSLFTSDACHRPSHRLEASRVNGIPKYVATVDWRRNMDWYSQDSQMYDLFRSYLEKEQPQLLHFHCIQRLTGSIVEAALDLGIPYIVTVHDAWWISDFQFLVSRDGIIYPQGHPDPYQIVRPPENISVSESLERRARLKSLLNRAERVLAVSESFAQLYRQNGIDNVVAVPNGISQAFSGLTRKTAQNQRVVAAHVGGMATHKGYFLLRDAVMAAQPHNMEFLVVDHRMDAGQTQKTLWGQVPVTFMAPLPQDSVADLYSQIDVLFAPSLWPESYGLVTREAAACGCWVVASDRGGIGEDVAEPEGGYVRPPTHEAMLEILQTIDADPARYKATAIHGPIRDSAQQAHEIAAIYQEILND